MHHFYQPDLDVSAPAVSGAEAHHGFRVLRLRSGSPARITDGQGTSVTGLVGECTQDRILLTETSVRRIPRPVPVNLGIGLLHHNDRMEWLVEKSTELGVTRVTFLTTKRSERNRLNTDRLLRIAISALKQSGGSWLPAIEGPMDLQLWFRNIPDKNRFVGHLGTDRGHHLLSRLEPELPASLLIGPEGDLTPEELEQSVRSGFLPVSLGATTLRAETAGMAGVFILRQAGSIVSAVKR